VRVRTAARVIRINPSSTELVLNCLLGAELGSVTAGVNAEELVAVSVVPDLGAQLGGSRSSSDCKELSAVLQIGDQPMNRPCLRQGATYMSFVTGSDEDTAPVAPGSCR
jgi:hypothetical protein